jgi:hypothetical protein
LPALLFDSLLLVRRGDATELILALASRQWWSATFLVVSRGVNGVSASIVFAADTIISVSAGASGSLSLSAFADSFSANSGSILFSSCAGSTTKEGGDASTLIAIAAPRPTKQKTANHIVLDILEPKAPAKWRRMGANLQDRIRATRWQASVRLERAGSANAPAEQGRQTLVRDQQRLEITCHCFVTLNNRFFSLPLREGK